MHVVLLDDFPPTELALEEIVHLLGDVEDHGHTHHEHDRQGEGAEKLPDNVPVQSCE